MVNRLTVERKLLYALWMDVGVELLENGFEKYHKTGYLHTASRAAGTCTDEHEHNDNGLARARPEVEVGCGKSGGRYY